MKDRTERNGPAVSLLRSKVALWAAGLLLVCGVTAGASGWIAEWWQKWTVTTEDVGGGNVHLTVTDESGDVAFDDIVPGDTAVFVTEEDDLFIVEPSDDPLVQDVLDEIAADEASAKEAASANRQSTDRSP